MTSIGSIAISGERGTHHHPHGRGPRAMHIGAWTPEAGRPPTMVNEVQMFLVLLFSGPKEEHEPRCDTRTFSFRDLRRNWSAESGLRLSVDEAGANFAEVLNRSLGGDLRSRKEKQGQDGSGSLPLCRTGHSQLAGPTGTHLPRILGNGLVHTATVYFPFYRGRTAEQRSSSARARRSCGSPASDAGSGAFDVLDCLETERNFGRIVGPHAALRISSSFASSRATRCRAPSTCSSQ